VAHRSSYSFCATQQLQKASTAVFLELSRSCGRADFSRIPGRDNNKKIERKKNIFLNRPNEPKFRSFDFDFDMSEQSCRFGCIIFFNFVPIPLNISQGNTQTRYFGSMKHGSIATYVFLKTVYPGGIRTRVFCSLGGCDVHCGPPPNISLFDCGIWATRFL
jgi:hypothetical protein